MDIRIKKRLEEIESQRKIIEKAELRLKFLLGMAENSGGAGSDKLPEGFSLMNEMLKIFRENGGKKMRTREIVGVLNKKWGVSFPRRNVQSTLTYLASPKKDLLVKEQEQRGVFSLKQKPPQGAG